MGCGRFQQQPPQIKPINKPERNFLTAICVTRFWPCARTFLGSMESKIADSGHTAAPEISVCSLTLASPVALRRGVETGTGRVRRLMITLATKIYKFHGPMARERSTLLVFIISDPRNTARYSEYPYLCAVIACRAGLAVDWCKQSECYPEAGRSWGQVSTGAVEKVLVFRAIIQVYNSRNSV